MSDILTRLRLPNSPSCGIMDWGRKSADEMIAAARKHGERLKAEGEALLNAPDEAFQIDIVRGSIVEHHVKELQKANAPLEHSERSDDTLRGVVGTGGHNGKL
jgi:hypothetical protein